MVSKCNYYLDNHPLTCDTFITACPSRYSNISDESSGLSGDNFSWLPRSDLWIWTSGQRSASGSTSTTELKLFSTCCCKKVNNNVNQLITTLITYLVLYCSTRSFSIFSKRYEKNYRGDTNGYDDRGGIQ